MDSPRGLGHNSTGERGPVPDHHGSQSKGEGRKAVIPWVNPQSNLGEYIVLALGFKVQLDAWFPLGINCFLSTFKNFSMEI